MDIDSEDVCDPVVDKGVGQTTSGVAAGKKKMSESGRSDSNGLYKPIISLLL